MQINGSQRNQLLQAIISAYPSKADLEMMIDFELEENLDAIAGGENYKQVVYKLIKWAEASGKLDKLIGAACNNNPGDEQLKDIKQKLVPKQLPEPDEVEVKLLSEVGVNYTKLRNRLAAGEWKKADEETYTVILKVVKRLSWWDVQYQEMDTFPCEDLRTVNELWLHYSKGKFGFSVQREIYQELGGENNHKIWENFGDRVAWRQRGNWLDYSSLTFNLNVPKGHLPTVLFGGKMGFSAHRSHENRSLLMQRLVTCKI